MIYTYCIWDFNGTILDDVDLGIYSINMLMERYKIDNALDKTSYREKFGFPIIDYYRKIDFDFEKISYKELANEWIKIYSDNFYMAKPYADVLTTLEFFKQNQVRQSVLSASERGVLKQQLQDLGFDSYFEDIMGVDNFYGGSKLDLAYEWRKNHPNDKVIFIGDTTHDIETANALGADCCIVCAGHQSKERFLGYNAKVFDSLSELVNTLK